MSYYLQKKNLIRKKALVYFIDKIKSYKRIWYNVIRKLRIGDKYYEKIYKNNYSYYVHFMIFLVGCGDNKSNTSSDNSKNSESSDNNTSNDNSKENANSNSDLPVATIEIKNYGTVEAELYPEIAPNTAGSQFFIMTSTSSHLDGQYAAFGKVISGMDVVKKIESVSTDANDKPKEKVVIKSIKVDTKGVAYAEPEKIK